MKYHRDENGNITKVTWATYQDGVRKRAINPKNKDKIGELLWVNSQEFIDDMVKKHIRDAKAFASTLYTRFLTDADKESLALEALYEAAGLYNPTNLGKDGKPMKFTSFMYRRIKQLLYREIKYLKMNLRCAQIPLDVAFPESTSDADDTDEAPVKPRSTKRGVLEIQESATGFEREDGSKKTLFEQYFAKEYQAAFDLEEVVTLLNKRLSDKQRNILEYLLKEDTDALNYTDISKELGVTRQAVNLHVQKIRRHAEKILSRLAPGVKVK